jgi:hypothetical protein
VLSFFQEKVCCWDCTEMLGAFFISRRRCVRFSIFEEIDEA